MDLQVRSYSRFARSSTFPGADAGLKLLKRVPLDLRKPLIKEMIGWGDGLTTRLVLADTEGLLQDFRARERVALYGLILRDKYFSYIAQYFQPTERKLLDLLKAALTLDPATFRSLPVESAAWLMACVTWDRIPAPLKKHPVFADRHYSLLKQHVLSLFREPGQRFSALSGATLCQATEAQFVSTVDDFKVTLVNDHFLFSDGPEWQVALTLRGVRSASGAFFPKGMFYFVSGRQNKERIEQHPRDRLTMPGLTWIPVRAFNEGQSHGTTVNELARLFPPEKKR